MTSLVKISRLAKTQELGKQTPPLYGKSHKNEGSVFQAATPSEYSVGEAEIQSCNSVDQHSFFLKTKVTVLRSQCNCWLFFFSLLMAERARRDISAVCWFTPPHVSNSRVRVGAGPNQG